MMNAFLYGAALALGLILPLGLQNVFIFNQGVTQARYVHVIPSVLTAILCDVVLILCAIFGVSMVVLTVPEIKNSLFIVGILFLTYMGYATWTAGQNTNHEVIPLNRKQQILFSMSVSLLNPHAILDTVGVIGTNAVQFSGAEKTAYTLACILVSCLWFFGLSLSGHCLKKKNTSKQFLLYLNKVSAFIIWIVAGYLGWQLIV